MQIIVNNFTKFKFEKLEDKLLSKKYLIEFENEYIKYRNKKCYVGYRKVN